jgi:hypothetical protein
MAVRNLPINPQNAPRTRGERKLHAAGSLLAASVKGGPPREIQRIAREHLLEKEIYHVSAKKNLLGQLYDWGMASSRRVLNLYFYIL